MQHRRVWKEPGRVEELNRLLEAGDLSARQIADKLGVSRNSVIGKCNRMKKDLPYAGQHSIPRAKVIPFKPPRLDVEGVPFLTVAGERGRCKYALGDVNEKLGPDMLCCGEPVLNRESLGMDSSYCSFHMKIVCGDGTKSEQRATEIV